MLVVVSAIVAIASPDVAHAAKNYVDFNKANDYYAALSSGRVDVVEKYHLGPCQQHLAKRNYAKATGECNFILKIFPNHPRALDLAIKTCQRWKAATCNLNEVFEQAISINPKASATFVLLGIYHYGARRYPEAIRSFEKSLELDSDSINGHYNLGLTYLETKAYDQANSHAQSAYALGATLPGLRERLVKAGHWKQTGERTSDAPKDSADAKAPGPRTTGDATGKP